jgi:hypothetical protein
MLSNVLTQGALELRGKWKQKRSGDALGVEGTAQFHDVHIRIDSSGWLSVTGDELYELVSLEAERDQGEYGGWNVIEVSHALFFHMSPKHGRNRMADVVQEWVGFDTPIEMGSDWVERLQFTDADTGEPLCRVEYADIRRKMTARDLKRLAEGKEIHVEPPLMVGKKLMTLDALKLQTSRTARDELLVFADQLLEAGIIQES